MINPSTNPIAKWIGCMKTIKSKNVSSVTPDRIVSITTLNAPSCKLTTEDKTEARIIFFLVIPFFIIGLYIQKYPKKHE